MFSYALVEVDEEVAEVAECVGIFHITKKFAFPDAVCLDDECLNHPKQRINQTCRDHREPLEQM